MWLTAIDWELQSIRDENVYQLVNRAKEKIENLLGTKFVLCHKRGPTGNIEHYNIEGEQYCLLGYSIFPITVAEFNDTRLTLIVHIDFLMHCNNWLPSEVWES